MEERRCTCCKEIKPLEKFTRQVYKNSAGEPKVCYRWQCRLCTTRIHEARKQERRVTEPGYDAHYRALASGRVGRSLKRKRQQLKEAQAHA